MQTGLRYIIAQTALVALCAVVVYTSNYHNSGPPDLLTFLTKDGSAILNSAPIKFIFSNGLPVATVMAVTDSESIYRALILAAMCALSSYLGYFIVVELCGSKLYCLPWLIILFVLPLALNAFSQSFASIFIYFGFRGQRISSLLWYCMAVMCHVYALPVIVLLELLRRANSVPPLVFLASTYMLAIFGGIREVVSFFDANKLAAYQNAFPAEVSLTELVLRHLLYVPILLKWDYRRYGDAAATLALTLTVIFYWSDVLASRFFVFFIFADLYLVQRFAKLVSSRTPLAASIIWSYVLLRAISFYLGNDYVHIN